MLPDRNNRYKPQGYMHINKVSSVNNEESSIFYDSNNTRNGARRKPLHRLCKCIQSSYKIYIAFNLIREQFRLQKYYRYLEVYELLSRIVHILL